MELYSLLCIIFILVLSSILLMIFIANYKGGWSTLRDNRNTLLIIAHPDDECMFFAPTICHLVSSGQRVKLLCLSEGNYYDQGTIRRKELIKACNVLGLTQDSITIINDKELPDDPKRVWSSDVISSYIKLAIKSESITRIITFDEHGVSNHLNHIAVHNTVRMLQSGGYLPGIEVLYLESVCVCRKYLSLLSPLAITRSNHVCVSSVNMWYYAMRALSKHRSQMVWYRQLYKWTSFYLTTNTYTY